MYNLLLSLHVLAGILFIGPVAVAASLFPRFAPVAASSDERRLTAERDAAVARLLHRVTRGYGLLALVVPVAGLALAGLQGRLGEAWITVAMLLTAFAGALLALRIVPGQREALETPDAGRRLSTLSMLTGVLNVLWVAVVVLMIIRPGAS